MAPSPGQGGAHDRRRGGGRPRRRAGASADAWPASERVLWAPGDAGGGRRRGGLPEHREAGAVQGHAARVRRHRRVAAGPRGEAATGGAAQAAGRRRDPAPRPPPHPAQGRGEGRGRRADGRAQAHLGAHHGPGHHAALPPARLRGRRGPRRRLRQGAGPEEQEGQGPPARGHREEARVGHRGRARCRLRAGRGLRRGRGRRVLGPPRSGEVRPGDRDVRAGPGARRATSEPCRWRPAGEDGRPGAGRGPYCGAYPR
mmetsp:Transcript_73605/g.193092  ORF Transcript_73605/g.193092 Transcript_73605/m.193092 type:complete len:257 (-) Transcript_73605:236-1006(-)